MAGFFGGQRRLPNIDPALGGLLRQEAGWSRPIQQPMQQPVPQQQPQRRGFFGQGGPGRAIAGTIGDVLLQRGGLAPIYAPQMELMQQAQAEEQQREQERANRREDMQWEWANKPAPNNDTVADYEFIRSRLGDDEAQKYLRNRADPPRYVQGPDGQFYPVQTAQPPTAPVGRLTPINGGPGGSPSGAGFRP